MMARRGPARPGSRILGGAGRHRAARRSALYVRRGLAIGLLAGVAVALLVFQYQFRHLEAVAAAHASDIVTPTLAGSTAPVIWFGLGSPRAFGLAITPDCSSALLIEPLCWLGMLLMIPRRLHAGRVAAALAVSATVLVLGNMARIGVIAIATRVGGTGTGYQFGHLVLGTAISVVCIAMSLTLLTIIVTSQDGGRLSSHYLYPRRRASS